MAIKALYGYSQGLGDFICHPHLPECISSRSTTNHRHICPSMSSTLSSPVPSSFSLPLFSTSSSSPFQALSKVSSTTVIDQTYTLPAFPASLTFLSQAFLAVPSVSALI